MILRDYQLSIIKQVHESMSAGNRRVLVNLATGGGKTVLFAWMADKTQKNGKTVWFLVHRRELLDQVHQTFEDMNISLYSIHIAMVGTVSNNLDSLPKPDLIVFDECHHNSARTWRRIVDHHSQAHVIGLTATPSRLDGKPLGDIFNSMVDGLQTAELIEQGYLSDYRLIVSEVSMTDLKKRAGEYIMRDAESQLNSRTIYGNVIQAFQEYASDKQAIYFCTTVNHSKQTAEEFNQAGIKAVHFDGRTSKKRRKQIIQDFRSGKTQVLTNVDLIGEGFDMPSCDCVGMLRPTASLTIYLQQVGRALRPAENKTAIIIDHVGNVNRHGLPCDVREWSLNSSVVTGRSRARDGSYATRLCQQCYTVYKPPETHCPNCGLEYETEQAEIEVMEEIKMIELKKQRLAELQAWAWLPETLEQADSYADLAKIGKYRGYKPGWAWHQAKQRGYWYPG